MFSITMDTRADKQQQRLASRENLLERVQPRDTLTFIRLTAKGSNEYVVYRVQDSTGAEITKAVSDVTGYRADKKRGGIGIGGSLDPAQTIADRLSTLLFGAINLKAEEQ